MTIQELEEPTIHTVSQLWREISDRINPLLVLPIRLRGVLRNLSRNGGHAYFDIIEDEPAANERATSRSAKSSISGVIWRSRLPELEAEAMRRGFGELRSDTEMVFIGTLNIFQPRGRLSFQVSSIDFDEMRRVEQIALDRIRASLRAEGIFDANRQLLVPAVPLRIAVVTSSAGTVQHDFRRPLDASGYRFEIELVDARVSGIEAATDLTNAIERASNLAVDLVVVLRGGGADSELALFSAEAVVRAVATCPLPVWCAIGHAADQVLINEVAHTAFDVPQSVGVALVNYVRGFLEEVASLFDQIVATAHNRIARAHDNLALLDAQLSSQTLYVQATARAEIENLRHDVHLAALSACTRPRSDVDKLAWELSAALIAWPARIAATLPNPRDLHAAVSRLIQEHRHRITNLTEQLSARDPHSILALGYTIMTDPKENWLRSAAAIATHPLVTVHAIDGTVTLSTTNATNATKEPGDTP
ncbi:MAG: exodeoxyribonuclease VII large subunit [Ferrimicrobium sp.]